jgi:hypothetical protein
VAVNLGGVPEHCEAEKGKQGLLALLTDSGQLATSRSEMGVVLLESNTAEQPNLVASHRYPS